MGDTLEIFGKEFTNVAGFKAKDDNGNTLTYTRGGGGTITIEEIPNATGTTLQITTNGSSSGGSSATQHNIYFEFSDNTNTTIPVYYNDALLSTMITAYTPETYNTKTVNIAKLDNVTWYERPTETWETILNSSVSWIKDDNNSYPYCWITELTDVYPTDGSVWRVTYEGNSYRCTAHTSNDIISIGNPKWTAGQDDGTDIPFVFQNQGWGAWTGSINKSNEDTSIQMKIERLVTT